MANTDLRTYIIDEEAKQRAAQVREFALAHRYSLTDMRKRLAAGTKPPGADPNHVLMLDALEPVQRPSSSPEPDTAQRSKNACRVVFVIEQHTDGWKAHFQVSSSLPRLYPDIGSVQRILNLFGIQKLVRESEAVEMEPMGPAKEAVNLWFPIDLKGVPIQVTDDRFLTS